MPDVLEALFDLTPPTQDQMRELVADLSEEERHLLLEHGEQAPFCGVFLTEKREGIYLPLVWTAVVQRRRQI
jgi:peptide-methionine (R)-S-oxide reductase